MARNSNSDFIDIKSVLRQYKTHWYLFVISVFVCLLLAFIYLKRTEPVYSVRANVLISQQKDVMSEAMGSLSDIFGSDGYVDDEIFIISSHTVYRDVVKALRLNIEHQLRGGLAHYTLAYPEYPVDIIPGAGIVDTLRTALSFKVKVQDDMKADITVRAEGDKIAKLNDVTLPQTIRTDYGDFTVAVTPTYPAGESLTTIITVKGYDAAAESLDETVFNEIASKRSNVISMNIETTEPEYGKDVLNEIITRYNLYGVEQKNIQGQLTADFLETRLNKLAAELSEAETAMQNYKQANGLTDVPSEALYQSEKKGRLEEALLQAETQSEILGMTSEFLADTANCFSMVPLDIDNEGIQAAVSTYNQLLARHFELLRTVQPDNLELQRIDQRIAMSRTNLRESLDRAKAAADVSLRQIQAQMADVENSREQFPQQEREYGDIYRQKALKSQLYLLLLRHNEENAIMMANATPKGQIIDQAYTMSEPLGIGNKAILLIALFVGLCIPPFWLWLRKLVYNRFETRADVERMTDVPILGEMCIDKSDRQMVVTADDTSSTAELFRLMRSNLLFVLTDARDKVVLMTSTSSGEGKSFISINLAASLALLGKNVLLVGMDIRNPQLSNYLDIHPRFGLTQYLASSDISLESLIHHMDEPSTMDVICAGPIPPNPAELLLSHRVDELFDALRERYDYIIVDTAPIGLVSDTFTLDRIADASIYVCRANFTSLSDLELINDIHEKHRLKKVSLVINGTAAKKSYGYRAKGKK